MILATLFGVPQPCFPHPRAIWHPTLFTPCGIRPCFPLKSHVLVRRWGTKAGAVLSQSSMGTAWQQQCPTAGQCEGTQSTQGFSAATGVGLHSDQSRQLLVTSPLPCKSHSEGDNNSFTEPRLYQHQHFIPAFIPCPPRACQEAQCPFSTEEPLLTVNFSPCVSLLTQHTQLPCFPPEEWDAL